jgi:hypothetical protein
MAVETEAPRTLARGDRSREEEPRGESSREESPTRTPASQPVTEPSFGRGGKPATRGLHSAAARADLGAAAAPADLDRTVAEAPVSTPQRRGNLAHDFSRFAREHEDPKAEIVSESDATPAGAPSDRYRAAESGAPHEPSTEARRHRDETAVDADESSEP